MPLGDEYYSDEANQQPRRPHFLYVTAADPNESMLGNVLHEATLRGVEKLSAHADADVSLFSALWWQSKHLAHCLIELTIFVAVARHV